MSELATTTSTALQQAPLEFTKEQEKMIRDTYASGASESEFQVLMTTARVRRLNPILRQIHFVSRNTKERDDNGREIWVKKWAAQVSIEGLRSIAERTGKYAGSTEPDFEFDEGRTRKMKCVFSGKTFDKPIPVRCKVGVRRRDWAEPCVGVVDIDEVVQTNKYGVSKFWDDMPRVMLEKCAEARALRRAFPEDLGGLYINEEMPPVTAEPVVAYVVDEDGVVSEPKALPAPAKEKKAKKKAEPEPEEDANLEKDLADSIAEADAKAGLHEDPALEFPPKGETKAKDYRKAVLSRGGLMGKLISNVNPAKLAIYREKYLAEPGGIPEAELNSIDYYIAKEGE